MSFQSINRPRQGGKSKISGTIAGSFQAGTIILTTLGKLYLRRLLGRAIKQRQDRQENPLLLLSSVILLILGALIMLPHGDFRNPVNVLQFFLGMGIASVGFILSWGLKSLTVQWFWLVAIAIRIILLFMYLFMYPGDDIWRYIWKGYIQTIGFSPYDLAPNASELIPYRTSWWEQISSWVQLNIK